MVYSDITKWTQNGYSDAINEIYSYLEKTSVISEVF